MTDSTLPLLRETVTLNPVHNQRERLPAENVLRWRLLFSGVPVRRAETGDSVPASRESPPACPLHRVKCFLEQRQVGLWQKPEGPSGIQRPATGQFTAFKLGNGP